MRKIIDKECFINKSITTILGMLEDMENVSNIKLKHLKKEETVLLVIDMINGFTKEGALASERVEGIIPYVSKISNKFKDYRKIFFVDTHTKSSVEFESYPEHALLNSTESDIVDELKEYLDENAIIARKNSTNGFLSADFADFLMKNQVVKNFIVVGGCTDICVMQFSLTLKAYFNEWNMKSRVIVPITGVETFDLDTTNHNGDLMNLFALYTMKSNGIELVSDIK